MGNVIAIVFGKLNNLKIIIYSLEEKELKSIEYMVYPLYSSGNYGETIHLLYIEDPKTKHEHFAWIRNISKLVSKQISSNGHKISICDNCFSHFYKRHVVKILRHTRASRLQLYDLWVDHPFSREYKFPHIPSREIYI
jgi:hypothetical protein